MPLREAGRWPEGLASWPSDATFAEPAEPEASSGPDGLAQL